MIQAEDTSSVADVDNVFAGGDAVSGPATVIRAVAAGKVAAANIDAYLGFEHRLRRTCGSSGASDKCTSLWACKLEKPLHTGLQGQL